MTTGPQRKVALAVGVSASLAAAVALGVLVWSSNRGPNEAAAMSGYIGFIFTLIAAGAFMLYAAV